MTYGSNVHLNELLRDPNSWDVDKLESLFLPYEVEASEVCPLPVITMMLLDTGNSKRRVLLRKNWLLEFYLRKHQLLFQAEYGGGLLYQDLLME